MAIITNLISTVLVSVAIANAATYCYDEIQTPYLYFSSKTAYEVVHEESTVEDHPGCNPKQFWILSRHGTRYPDSEDIDTLNKEGPDLHEKIVGHDDIELCKADIDRIKAWKMTDMSGEDGDMLTIQGFLDLYNIARRYQKRFPSLLDRPYDSQLFKFRHTDSPRTADSAQAFAEGLFGSSTPVEMPLPVFPDPLIETFEACPSWLENVANNPDSKKEAKAFKKSAYMVETVAKVSERLGFDSSPLNFDDVDILWDLCRYEKAWDPSKVSTWCAAFTEEELKVLEYREDLKYYYTESHGIDLNAKVGCPPVKDFFERFSSLEAGGSDEPLGVFYFSHSTMINMVLARLGLYKDASHLTSTNYLSMQDRLYRSSKTGSFATNIAAVFYECSEGERNRFQLFVEERPVQLKGCPEGELCSWSHVKQMLETDVEECNLSFCDM